MRTNYTSPLDLTIQTVRNPKERWLSVIYYVERKQSEGHQRQQKSFENSMNVARHCLKLMEKSRPCQQASAEYRSFLELKELLKHLKLSEKAIKMANVCLENIEIMINKRVKAMFSEPCCDYAPLLELESASCNTSFLHVSKNEKCPCVM